MAVLITACVTRTCLGDGASTFAALLAGRSGVDRVRHVDPGRVGVTHAYPIREDGPERPLRAGHWLAGCMAEALAESGVDPARRRVVGVVGTGLRQLRLVEFPNRPTTEALHFGSVAEPLHTLTIANACSAGGHALALAQDLIELGDADAVVVGAADTMTESMLAMIGRVTEVPARQVRPFDADRPGVLLGDGAGALVVEPDTADRSALARLLATGLSCDAFHETAPSLDGIRRAMRDAHRQAGRSAADVDLVVAHGTGTALNDPTEAAAIGSILGVFPPGPLVTAVKGAVGHTSGHAALANVDVAMRCLASGVVPPVVGLRTAMPEAVGLRLVVGQPVHARLRLAQVNAFGFGGVNAVSLLEAVR